jgi:hypothetical protein
MNASSPASARRPLPVKMADLRGLALLGLDGVVGVTNLVEAMHHTIASGAGIVGPVASGRTSGITGLVYRGVRGTTRALGLGLDSVLSALPAGPATAEREPRREAWLAALNGVWGDHLVDNANPLAIAMSLRSGGRALDLAAPLAPHLSELSGRIVVLAHGLGMNDLQWQRQGHDHGQMLARELGYTPLYLHYNSGRHVWHNGRDFAALLARLVAAWPVPCLLYTSDAADDM